MGFRQCPQHHKVFKALQLRRHAVGIRVIDIGFINHHKGAPGQGRAQAGDGITVHQVCSRIVRRTDEHHLRIAVDSRHDAAGIEAEIICKRHLAHLDALQHRRLHIHRKGRRADDDIVDCGNAERPHQAVDPLVRAARDRYIARGQVEPVADRANQFRRLLHRVARETGCADKRLVGALVRVQKYRAAASRHKRARRNISLHRQNLGPCACGHAGACIDFIHLGHLQKA